MKMIYRFAMLIFILLRSSLLCFAQDVGFSQFYEQPLLRNPALAGIFTGDFQLTASYRNQWQSVTIPYRTFGLSTEIKFPVRFMNSDFTVTPGLQLLRDVAGTSEFSTTHVMPAINLSKAVSQNSFVSVAFLGGLMQQKFDPSKLVLNDQFIAGSDGSFTILPYSGQIFNRTSINYFDLSTGLSFSTSFNENTDFYAGAGLFHLTAPSVGSFEGSEILLNKKLAFNIGLSTLVSDRDELTLYGDYFDEYGKKFNRIGISTFQAGIMVNHNISPYENIDQSISAGILYRLDDAIIPVIQLGLSKFNIGISYDININKLAVASQARGGLEITLSYRDIFKSRDPLLQSQLCPKFGSHKRLN
ncbi:MAG TPA: PorP/SprF family type IX secretion system membrane protein [Panacibacter sp.]|nr:PorP/SprF family type IX secretion system membrane protein [Panacibacter sp.]